LGIPLPKSVSGNESVYQVTMASNSGMASDPAMGGGQQGNYGAVPPRSMRGEPRKTISPFIAEFLGTFVFVFAVGCSIITGDSSWNATGMRVHCWS